MEIFLWVLFAGIVAAVANAKGRSGVLWFFIGLIFPLLFLVIILLLPSLKQAPVFAGGEIATPDTHVRCPECRELVRKDARKCKHCSTALIPVE